MKLKKLALVLCLVAAPGIAGAATAAPDPYALYQSFVRSMDGDGIWASGATTAVSDSKSGDREDTNIFSTSTDVGGSGSCSAVSRRVSTSGDVTTEIYLTIDCRVIGDQSYVRVTDGWVKVNGKRAAFSETTEGRSLLNAWFYGSAEDVTGADDVEGASENFDGKALDTLGKKDATFSLREENGVTTLTAKVSPKSKLAKANALFRDATITFVGDAATGKATSLDVVRSAKIKSVRLSARDYLKRVGSVPVGTTVTRPAGKVGSTDDFNLILESASESLGLALLPVYSADDDYFSAKFTGGEPAVIDEASQDALVFDGTLESRLYYASGEGREEWVRAKRGRIDGQDSAFSVADDEIDGFFDRNHDYYVKTYKAKNIKTEREISVEGYRALRTVYYNPKTKYFVAMVDLQTEERTFEIAAAAKTQVDAERRVDQLVASFSYF